MQTRRARYKLSTASGQKGRSPADASRLSRTITDAAHEIITEKIHRDLKEAKVDRGGEEPPDRGGEPGGP